MLLRHWTTLDPPTRPPKILLFFTLAPAETGLMVRSEAVARPSGPKKKGLNTDLEGSGVAVNQWMLAAAEADKTLTWKKKMSNFSNLADDGFELGTSSNYCVPFESLWSSTMRLSDLTRHGEPKSLREVWEEYALARIGCFEVYKIFKILCREKPDPNPAQWCNLTPKLSRSPQGTLLCTSLAKVY